MVKLFVNSCIVMDALKYSIH